MHTLKVAVIDLPAKIPYADVFDLVRASMESKLHLVPRLRLRPVEVPGGLHHPMWVNDPNFDIARHLYPHEDRGARRPSRDGPGHRGDRQHSAAARSSPLGDVAARGAGRRRRRLGDEDPSQPRRRRRVGHHDGEGDDPRARPGRPQRGDTQPGFRSVCRPGRSSSSARFATSGSSSACSGRW